LFSAKSAQSFSDQLDEIFGLKWCL